MIGVSRIGAYTVRVLLTGETVFHTPVLAPGLFDRQIQITAVGKLEGLVSWRARS